MRFSVEWRSLTDLGVAKNSVRISVILKLLLNHKELEGAFYMKKLRLDNIFPTVYHLDHSDEQFVQKNTNEQPQPYIVRRTIFKIKLKL